MNDWGIPDWLEREVRERDKTCVYCGSSEKGVEKENESRCLTSACSGRLEAGRGGTPDEVGAVGSLLMGPDGAFITGSDFLMDGGVTAAYWYGELAPK
jgi:hypothetical protein